jgi:hypothetical protein
VLTTNIIKKAAPKGKPYKLSDFGGLYLLIHSNSSKYWRVKYRFSGKEKVLALGVYPQVSLFEAREKLYQAKNNLANGIDPSELKKGLKQKKPLTE